MDETQTLDNDDRLDAAILEYHRQAEAGREPDRIAFLEDHPDLAERLRAYWADQDFVGGMVSGSETPRMGADETGSFVSKPKDEPFPDIPGFRILSRIGQGGMGSVYRARDENLPREVAIKVMRPEVADRPEHRERFLREAQALASLNHDHVVRIILVGEANGSPYLVMPLLEGESLSDRLKRVGRLPTEELERLGREVALGLSAIHHAGQLHRDLKPSNVWLETAQHGSGEKPGGWGRALILDFGLAKTEGEDSELTAAGSILGTPAYMAPEQAAGDEVTKRADLFSLGSLLYHAASGTPPFGAGSVTEIVTRLMTKTPKEPPALSGLIMRLLEKDPADRYESADLVIEELRRADGGQTIPTPAAPTPKRRRAWAALALVPVLTLVLVATLYRPVRPEPIPPIGKPEKEFTQKPVKSFSVEPLEVVYFENIGGDVLEPRGPVWEYPDSVKWNDALRIRVRLGEPGYFYLIGYNFDGNEQLLWPLDEQTAPTEREELIYPEGVEHLFLNDEAPGGTQAYVVAASQEPLPSWEKWKAGRGSITWKQHPPMPGVWAYDGKETLALGVIVANDRGSVKQAANTTPLTDLCRSLKGGGIEAIDSIVFPVHPRE